MKSIFTASELASLCHVSHATIFRAIIAKRLHASTTPGGHFRIQKEDALSFLKENKIPLPEEGKHAVRILIVEDNPVERRYYSRALESDERFDIRTAGTGYEAGFLTQSFRPDILLLDIHLPDVNGAHVAKLVRSDENLKHTKIVAMTGRQSPNLLNQAKSLRLDGFIQKPIAPGALVDRINEILKD